MFKSLMYLLLFCCLLQSCRKEEPLFVFKEKDKIPPATNKDTAISVTALLNGDTFLALGRAAAPDDSLSLSFYNVAEGSFLDIKILADTPGTYTLGRTVSAYTVAFYRSAKDKSEKKGYTSRATEEAGGSFTVTTIDTVTHKIKGSFHLLLLSRTDTARYQFTSGSFDVLYNHAEMQLGGKLVKAMPKALLNEGTPAIPQPAALIYIGDTMLMKVKFDPYKGAGSYTLSDGLNVTFTDVRDGKTWYNTEEMTAELQRFNFSEFLQFTFRGKIKGNDGGISVIEQGSFVMGN